MARALRGAGEGAWHHITSRGNERGVIPPDDEENRRNAYQLYVEALRGRKCHLSNPDPPIILPPIYSI